MTPEAAAGFLTAGRHLHASPAVAPAREGGAAAAERAGTGGWAGAAAAGRGLPSPRRLGIPTPNLGIPTPNLDNFSGCYSLAAILAATLSHAALVAGDLALAAPHSASSSPASMPSSSASLTAWSSLGVLRSARHSESADRLTPSKRASSAELLATPSLMAWSRYLAICFMARTIFCSAPLDKLFRDAEHTQNVQIL